MTINRPRSGAPSQILPHGVRMIEKRVMDQITFFPHVDKCAFTYWGDTVDNFIVEPQQIYLLKFTFHLLFKAKHRQ